MAVLQMQKLCICALKKDRKSLMEFLQAAGVLELTAEAEPDEVFKRTDTLEDRQKFERNAATADRVLWLTGEGGDGPDRHHGSVLCIFVWSDAFRCGIRIYCIFDVLPGT